MIDDERGRNATWDEFLRAAKVTDDPVGDLIEDLRSDRSRPRSFGSREALESYLRLRSACHEAVAAAKAVWGRYVRWSGKRLPVGRSPGRPN